MNILEQVKQITCILPKGQSFAVQKGLIDDHQIYEANFHYARGVGKLSMNRGFGEQREKEILEVMVKPEIADEIFEYIFFKAEMNQPHGGIMYMTTLPKMSAFNMPNFPDA
ncbi:MAG: hypothetical protein ACI9FB_004212 [Candidatus Azotimanducaceae bacterium]|jgi:hypothetical protein